MKTVKVLGWQSKFSGKDASKKKCKFLKFLKGTRLPGGGGGGEPQQN